MPEGKINQLNPRQESGSILVESENKSYSFTKLNLADKNVYAKLVEGMTVQFTLKPDFQTKKLVVIEIKLLNSQTTNLTQRATTGNPDLTDNISQAFATLPYAFLPVDTQKTVLDTPVWHDGSCGGDLLSGEILCTLTALTPLMPGNARYSKNEADPEKLEAWGFSKIDQKKQIAEPLRLPEPDGRVVIAGSALKGMIRHSLSALLSAPMERVEERRYTYRPNLDFNSHAVQERYVVRPALVKAARNGEWEIEVFDNPKAALFVRHDAESIIRNAASEGQISGNITGVEREIIQRPGRPKSVTNHLIPSPMAHMSFSHRLALYRGGIDGKGLLAVAFNKKDNEELRGRLLCGTKPPGACRGPFTYDLALVPIAAGAPFNISAECYKRYLDDQTKILADKKNGHLSAHPLPIDTNEVEKAITDASEFSVGQLIYIELSTDKGKVTKNSKVVSCGHHFRYRWAYTSSVRMKGDKLRDCLAVHANEQGEKPQQLTGERLFFGYVKNEETPIGKGVYERLAGRIVPNHAVSQMNPLFLGEEEKGYCVPLKILGKPRPSAYEFYLQQPAGSGMLQTYGDLPGDAGGDLAGRKYYPHQPAVQESQQIALTDQDGINSEQATLARFVCQPGTTFKFTLRFARLREWELGALLAVLEPYRLVENGKPEDYAHKLGLGRPLGMGSVAVQADQVRVRAEKETVLGSMGLPDRQKSIAAAKSKIDPEHLNSWLAMHHFDENNPAAAVRKYPVANVDGKKTKTETIYAWHSKLRRDHARMRRQQ